MTTIALSSLAHALGASLSPEGASLRATGVSIDSRTLVAGQIFVALRGGSHDGHAFIAAAESRGMVAAVVEDIGAEALVPGHAPRLVVGDTAAALLQIGAWCRAQHTGPVIGVTGSNGKTTTKELVAAALRSQGPIHKTHGNLNNHLGVPLTLAAWPDDAPLAVIEMGMSAQGEIAQLARVARPDVGLVTCVAAAHLEHLGTLENVARAKSELYEGLGPRGIAVVNDDDDALRTIAPQAIGTRSVLRFGRSARSDVRLLSCRSAAVSLSPGQLSPRLEVTLAVGGHRYQAVVPVLGEHNAMNVCAAVAAAWAVGVAPPEALCGMEQVVVPGSRAALRPLKQGRARLLDDCYNANPGSVRAALRSVGSFGSHALAIVGDMLELGPTSAALHEDMGRAAIEAGVQEIWSVGARAADVARGVAEMGGTGRAFDDVDSLIAALPSRFDEVDTWLVKGSRGMRLERVVQALVTLDEQRKASWA